MIVRARPGSEAGAEALARRLGGSVRARLQIIGGFSATLPANALGALRSSGAVLSVTPNTRLAPQSSSYSADYDPASDIYSMASITQLTGARSWWSAGYTGAGVDVAMVDSGVAPVEGLDGAGKIVDGPDLSLESQASNLRYLDTYGHGTFMAGLIAGRGGEPSSDAPAATYLGMAPDARIVSLKVATADGGTDVSEVIAAIDWIVQHRTDDGLDIRIINLSYATDAVQDAGIDPLAYAAEQAWKQGLVVVAAGGNYGFQSHMNSAPALGDPALDRYVVAVGSSDSLGTPSLADDVLPAFSPWPKRGATRGVDLVAPGVHIQGLRVANSFIDANHPEGLINGRYFRGSGTSQSAAIVSGAAALILEKYPDATPDQVKKLLTTFAYPIKGKSQADRCGRTSAGTRPRIPTAELDANMGVLVGNRLPRGFSRLESHRARRRGAERRSGHLRGAGGHDGSRGRRGHGQLVVGRGLERQQLEWRRLERQLLVGELVVVERLVRQLLVGELVVVERLVRQLLVRELLVRRKLGRRGLGLGGPASHCGK